MDKHEKKDVSLTRAEGDFICALLESSTLKGVGAFRLAVALRDKMESAFPEPEAKPATGPQLARQ